MLPMGIYFNCVYEVNAQFILFLTQKNLECVHKLTNETNDTRNKRTNYMNETQTKDTCKQKRYEISINLTIQGLYVKTRADNSGYRNHRVICLVPLLIVNKYSKFQMDTFDSFREMDSDKNLTDADAGVTTIA